jgi:hypothetical protein
MLKKFILFIFLFTILFLSPAITLASQKQVIHKAAFIRTNDLWIKVGNRENQVTNKEYIRYPKWSPDGTWIAYLKVTKTEETAVPNDGELWLFNCKINKHFKIKSGVNKNFQWASRDNKVSFLIRKDLYSLNLEPGIPFLAAKVADNIENFSWLPDDSGFLTSSKKSKQLHSDILLSKITLKTHKQVIKPISTIPVRDNEFFISTSQFKWSYDQKWISFLLIPTASLSADANTLCLLSQDGQVIRRAGEMLNDEKWFKWAPSERSLGYVKGVGREANLNKQTEIILVPSMSKMVFTPEGYVDRDISWKNNQIIYIARAKEDPHADFSKRPLPCIYKVNLSAGQQTQVTFPSEKEADFVPQSIGNKLLWIRTNKLTASIFVLEDKTERKWIKNITMASSYYDRWNWEEVFSIYTGGDL